MKNIDSSYKIKKDTKVDNTSLAVVLVSYTELTLISPLLENSFIMTGVETPVYRDYMEK